MISTRILHLNLKLIKNLRKSSETQMYEASSTKMQKIERYGRGKESTQKFQILGKGQIRSIKAQKEIINKLIVSKLNKELNDACK